MGVMYCDCNHYTIIIICTALPPDHELVLTPPNEVQAHCSHVNWRNSPNVSCEDISGYDVRLYNPDTKEEVIRRVDTRGTFHNFPPLDKNLTRQRSTTVQVHKCSYGNQSIKDHQIAYFAL